MFKLAWRSTVALGAFAALVALVAIISASATAGEPQDQGPVILGMDDWVDDGTVDVIGGPWSGVTISEQEPNDTAGTANLVGLSDNYVGTISTGSEYDFVAFTVNANDGMIFETISGGGTLSDTTLSLMDANGTTELVYDDDGGQGLYSKIDYFFPVAGTYYIKAGSYSSNTGSYLLQVRLMSEPAPSGGWAYIQRALEAMAPAVFVPNDGSVAVLGSADSAATSGNAGAAYHHAVPAAAANAPALSGEPTFHSGANGVSAFFNDLAQGNVRPAIIVLPGSGATNSLDAAEGVVLTSNAHLIAEFIGSGGGLLSHGDEAGSAVSYGWLPAVFPGMSVGQVINYPSLTDEGQFSLPEMQQTYIASGAHGYFQNHGMSIFAASDGVSAPGPFSGVTVTDQESNDSYSTANSISVGDDFTGNISTGSDPDYVAFSVSAGEQIIAETLSGGGSLSDTTLTLYSTNGTTQLEYDDDGGVGLYSLIEYTFATAGMYFLKVESYGTNTGSYHMQLRELLPPAPLAVVVGRIPGPWVWMGNPLSGLNGNPLLTGSGDLTAGSNFSLDLSRARTNSSALMVVGFWNQGRPFKGGLMVPNPAAVIPLATDSAGAITIPGTVASGSVPGVTLFVQYWIRDAAGDEGFSASNGLSLTLQ